MGDIRRQTIFSSLGIYVGFLFGGLNTYLFTHKGYFTPDQYGLTSAILAINMAIYSFANLGGVGVIGRFFPIYNYWLKKEENDLFFRSARISAIGTVLTIVLLLIGKDFFVRKFSEKSGLLVQYYFWIIPFVCSYVAFNLLEAQSAINKRTVYSNFLKETGSRIYLTILITIYLLKWIDFDLFVKLFTFMYTAMALALGISLKRLGDLHFVRDKSKVTRRLQKHRNRYILFPIIGAIIYNVGINIDSITIGSQRGLATLGVYTLAKYISSIISVPQRSVVSIAIPYISQAFKEKKYAEVGRIYKRSALNLLIIALFVFLNVWLNVNDAYSLFQLDESYRSGYYIILILGIAMIIDMGTGINSSMMYVSPIWKVEFYNTIIVMAMSIPLNYFLVKRFGMTGAAISNFFVVVTPNIIRFIFIWKRFKLQPLTINSLYILLLAIASYLLSWVLFQNIHGWVALALRSASFSLTFLGSVIYLKLSPDIQPVLDGIRKKIRKS
jgi:O-antigen/teichoic acid export membrane protein